MSKIETCAACGHEFCEKYGPRYTLTEWGADGEDSSWGTTRSAWCSEECVPAVLIEREEAAA